MKKRMCRWFFRKELAELNNELETQYRIKFNTLHTQILINEKRFCIVKRIFNLFPDAEITGIAKNKLQDELLIVINNNEYLYLFGEKYQGITNLPRIIFRINEDQGCKWLYIDDVQMVDDNIGNGTVAMKELIKYAKKIKANHIEGSLSCVDDDHADRRNHYYKKFGFEIEKSKIRLNLDDANR